MAGKPVTKKTAARKHTAVAKQAVTTLAFGNKNALAHLLGLKGTELQDATSRLNALNAKIDTLATLIATTHTTASSTANVLDGLMDERRRALEELMMARRQATQEAALLKKFKLDYVAMATMLGFKPASKKRVTKVTAPRGKHATLVGDLSEDLRVHPDTVTEVPLVDSFEAFYADVQAQVAAMEADSPVVMPVVISLFGKEVSPADLEKHVEELLQARAVEVQSAADAQLKVHKDAEAELRKQLDRANAQITAKAADVAALTAKLTAAVEDRDLKGRQLDTALRIMKRAEVAFEDISHLVPTRDAAKYDAIIDAAKLDEDPLKTK